MLNLEIVILGTITLVTLDLQSEIGATLSKFLEHDDFDFDCFSVHFVEYLFLGQRFDNDNLLRARIGHFNR